MSIKTIKRGIVPPVVLYKVSYEGTCCKCNGEFTTTDTKDMFLRTYRGEDCWAIHCLTPYCSSIVIMETKKSI